MDPRMSTAADPFPIPPIRDAVGPSPAWFDVLAKIDPDKQVAVVKTLRETQLPTRRKHAWSVRRNPVTGKYEPVKKRAGT
jgi:hypothetical protein